MNTNMKKIIAPVGMAAFALACIFGGMAWTAHVDAVENEKIQAELAQRDAQAAQESQNAMPEVVYSFPPIETPASQVKDPAAIPKASYVPASETVTVEEDGTVTIVPDFAHQKDGATKIRTPEVQVTANIGSGGSQLELGQDGTYHGDNPATQPPVVSTPVPAAPTPAPVESTTPEATPAPDPVQEPQGGPPSYNGTKDGEMSPDGGYMWIGGLGWLKQGVSDGGIGGQIDDSDYGWAPGEMGATVGSM